MPIFSTPQAATAAVKRTLRENSISSRTVRSSRTSDDKYLTSVFMPESTSDATYSKLASVLMDEGFKVKLYVTTGWAAVTSDAAS